MASAHQPCAVGLNYKPARYSLVFTDVLYDCMDILQVYAQPRREAKAGAFGAWKACSSVQVLLSIKRYPTVILITGWLSRMPLGFMTRHQLGDTTAMVIQSISDPEGCTMLTSAS